LGFILFIQDFFAYLHYDLFELTEYKTLKGLLSNYELYRFRPSKKELSKLLDGGVAVVDQWIAAHAR